MTINPWIGFFFPPLTSLFENILKIGLLRSGRPSSVGIALPTPMVDRMASDLR